LKHETLTIEYSDMAAFQLSMISFQFMFGKLYQMFSIKIIFMISCAIFEVGSLLCATAATSKQFIVGRAFCGMGSSGLIQGAFTMGMASVPLRQRSLYGGFGGAIEAIAQVSYLLSWIRAVPTYSPNRFVGLY
jgi:MFS family permease